METKARADYSKAHVLVVPSPVPGHINPMLQFATRLAFKGLRATLATTFVFDQSWQIEMGTVAVECIGGLRAKHVHARDDTKTAIDHLETIMSQGIADVMERYQGSEDPFTCLIYDSFLPYALDLARKHGLFGAAFFSQPCAVDATYYLAYKGWLTGALETRATLGLSEFGLSDLPSFISTPGAYPAIHELCLSQFSNIENTDYVLVNTFDKLEAEVVNWLKGYWPIKTIGPTVPSMYLDEVIEGDKTYGLNVWSPCGNTCMKWLETKPIASVVYVSIGSLATLETKQMEELAWGLRESNKYFLWIVRESEEEKLPINFGEETTEKGLLVHWCPQLEVLAHQAVGCFVTHCGWNSTVEALSLGVPMVAMPQWADQPTNAKYVEDIWGIGVRVRRDENGIVRREEMSMCIREIMEGERKKEIKRNADKWRECAKEAIEVGGSSNKNIAEFVDSLLRK